jgi:hypothetical protein
MCRLLALEMGKPVLINDQDCDIDLPCPVDDQYLTEEGKLPDGQDQQTTPMLATIHVVRSIGQLTRTLRSISVSPATLETFERHFNTCLGACPAHLLPKADQDLDPRSLAPIIYLQNARLLLHRHNISPYCSSADRSSARDLCVLTAIDTANILSRCMRDRESAEDWRPLFASCAGTLLCTHIWRCALFLLYRKEFGPALTCVQAISAVGDSRSVNAACGRYLAFFLRTLIDRARQGDAMSVEHDEEIIAYVSGDMQGASDSSWVWQGNETGSDLEAVPSMRTTPAPHEPEAGWEGWEWIEKTIQYLLIEKQQTVYERRDVPLEPRPNSSMLNPDAAGSDSPDRRSSSAHSRMTIASII